MPEPRAHFQSPVAEAARQAGMDAAPNPINRFESSKPIAST